MIQRIAILGIGLIAAGLVFAVSASVDWTWEAGAVAASVDLDTRHYSLGWCDEPRADDLTFG